MNKNEAPPAPESEESGSSGRGLRTLRRLVALVALVLFWIIGNYTIKVTHTEIYSPKISDEIKLVLISDLHGMEFGDENLRLLKKIDGEAPDAVLIAGDMHTNYDNDGLEAALAFIKKLQYPVYLVHGEHDKISFNSENLGADNIHILSPHPETYSADDPAIQKTSFTVNDTVIDIVGVNYCSAPYSIAEHTERDANRFTIVLTHIFDIDNSEEFGADLTLSGDTHGGIVRLPCLGAVYYEGKWFPSVTGEAPVYDKGLFEYKGGGAYISGGLGAYPYPVRLFNRPEINTIILKPSKSAG